MSTLTSHQVTEADRDHCIDLLSDAYAHGHVDKAELEVRVERALSTQHSVELDELRAGLPTVGARVPPRQRGKGDTLVAVGALVIALGISGVVAADLESEPVQQATSVATGLTLSDSVECPELSKQQEALTADAESAAAAAEQVAELSSTIGNTKLDQLSTKAEAAADRGRGAIAHAQLVVALDPDGVQDNDLRAEAKEAKAAANDAIRAAVEANKIARR